MLFEGGGQSCHQKRTQSTTLLLAGLSGEAQILDRMEKAAKRAAERTIENRVERGTEKALNKTIDKGVDGAKRDTSSTTTQGRPSIRLPTKTSKRPLPTASPPR